MARGIIYVMTTVVPGLVKIGKTGTSNFEERMHYLEHNGYSNITGLRRAFAIEVDDYDEKESMLDDIFSRSSLSGTELFALDVNLVIQLLSSFEGNQVYPQAETKEEAFDKATADHVDRLMAEGVPDGTYQMRRRSKKDGRVIDATMEVEGGSYIIRAGQRVSTIEAPGVPEAVKALRSQYVDPKGLVTSDVSFDSPSSAGSFVLDASCDGWRDWRCEDGKPISRYRKKS